MSFHSSAVVLISYIVLQCKVLTVLNFYRVKSAFTFKKPIFKGNNQITYLWAQIKLDWINFAPHLFSHICFYILILQRSFPNLHFASFILCFISRYILLFQRLIHSHTRKRKQGGDSKTISYCLHAVWLGTDLPLHCPCFNSIILYHIISRDGELW